jgi:hypothetical protein
VATAGGNVTGSMDGSLCATLCGGNNWYVLKHKEDFTILTSNINSYLDKQEHIVQCTPFRRQRPKYAHAKIENVLEEVFSMWSVPCRLLGNGSLNTFPQKQTGGTIGHLLLGNGAIK